MAYRVAPLPIPLNDLEGHFCCLKPFELSYLMKRSTNLLTQRVARSLCSSSASCFQHKLNISLVSLAYLTVIQRIVDAGVTANDVTGSVRYRPDFTSWAEKMFC